MKRHRLEQRDLRDGEEPENVVLQFRPSSSQPMYIPCLWSHWEQPGSPDLLSFAIITDEPPPEVAAAGHDRCPISIQQHNVDSWLRPESLSVDQLQAILDDRPAAYYEHQLAA